MSIIPNKIFDISPVDYLFVKFISMWSMRMEPHNYDFVEKQNPQ